MDHDTGHAPDRDVDRRAAASFGFRRLPLRPFDGAAGRVLGSFGKAVGVPTEGARPAGMPPRVE